MYIRFILFFSVVAITLASQMASAEPAVSPSDTPNLSRVPGVVIYHSPAETGRYIGSPCIVVLPDGSYIASHDIFGPENMSAKTTITRVYRSVDQGKTWEHLSTIRGQFWSTLFYHHETLYIFGTNAPGGDMIIRKSEDHGITWTEPKDQDTGLISESRSYHTAPVPVVAHNGRIWRVFEAPTPGVHELKAFVVSAPENADLLRADSWKQSSHLSHLDHGIHWWLEGNVVVTPEDSLATIMRVVDPRRFERGGKAAYLQITEQGDKLEIDPESHLIDFPGGSKMFAIHYDQKSRLYWTLSNAVLEPLREETTPHEFLIEEKTRNTQVLMASSDLRNWEMRSLVLYHPDTVKHGFQYVHWKIDGDDIVAVSRTAYDDGLGGANSQHDANLLTFHRIEDFRNLHMSEEAITQIIDQGEAFDIETHRESARR